ncbi:tyrosine protein kinase [Burkholderia vietnamiensis]|uniref:tyrosine protein kinase n=1 Tax=Burkholderia vietnamiensis TaxID=60552 RepID=UPI001B94C141|nr:tyrosine protein kinase [Burkholderia vietnamiensis]MBR8280677.1 tyrosine protein kinase [Burkholderia vietnamiensis]
MLDAAARRYDIVIVDPAPILVLHDAASIGRRGTTLLLWLGVPGFTVHAGRLTIDEPNPGETAAVAAARWCGRPYRRPPGAAPRNSRR